MYPVGGSSATHSAERVKQNLSEIPTSMLEGFVSTTVDTDRKIEEVDIQHYQEAKAALTANRRLEGFTEISVDIFSHHRVH